jgi:hypothetical protein
VLAIFDVHRRALGLAYGGELAGMMRVARSAGWWWPFEHAVLLTERPTALHADEQHRLHRVDGPALSFADGWSVYAQHGRPSWRPF